MRLVSTIFASLVATTAAAAEPLSSPTAAVSSRFEPSAYTVGVRVGGYGFRRAGDPGAIESAGGNAWNECRMNGLGLFAQRALAGPLFAEVGLDTYFSAGRASASDLPIDRMNALVSVAVGVRTPLTSWLVGHVQLGAGGELARVSVPYGDAGTLRANKLTPDGFLGIGADVRVGRSTYVGAAMRTHVMANFDYDPARLRMANPWVAAPSSNDVFSASPALAAQGQFYLRHDL